MTLPAGNKFELEIASTAEGTRPATAFGTSITPGNNTYGTAVELIASNHASWAGNGDAYAIEVNVNSNNVAGQVRDALIAVEFRRVIASIDTGADTLTFAAAHGFDLADPIRLTNSGGSLPNDAGGDLNGSYFAIPVSSTVIQIATSEANARAGTEIDITDAGSGTNTAHCEKIQHLGAACAGPYSGDAGGMGGMSYLFPLHVPNGTAIDVKGRVDNATVGTMRVHCTLYLKPTKQWAIRTGTFVRTFGAGLSGASGGTSFTAGTASEGSDTELGTLADDLWYWTIGFGVDNATLNSNIYEIDLGAGVAAADDTILTRVQISTSAAEQISKPIRGSHFDVPSGHKIYGRGQVGPNAAVTGISLLAYGVGGRFVPPNTHTVAGTVTIDGAAAANGENVLIYAVDDDGIPELVTTVQIAGGAGAFTAGVPDNTRDYFAKYDDGTNRGVSALDTPV